MSEKQNRSIQYVFLVGAAKCGTTAFAELLETHPDICVSSPKEPDYFTNEGIGKGEEWYFERFAHNPDAPIRIDASVSYSAGWGGGSGNIAARILSFAPSARIIYIMRDPIERARAAYWHARRSGYEKASLIDAISDPSIDHVQASLYHARIHDYLGCFSRGELLLLTQGSLLTRPQKTLDGVFLWLGLDCVPITATRANPTYQFSTFGRVLGTIVPTPVLQKLGRMLRKHFPERALSVLKSFYSKPIPALTLDESQQLRKLFEEDSQKLFDDFGINVRTSHFWKNDG